MTRTLALAAVAALAAAALAVPAGAAPPVCLQIVDASGDGALLGLVPENQPALDVVSGDIATGKRNLVAALRVKSLGTQSGDAGRKYAFSFTAGGTSYSLQHVVGVDGSSYSLLKDGTVTTPVDATADNGTSTITWTVPRRLVPALKKSGTKITGLGVATSHGASVSPPGGRYESFLGNDAADTPRSYTDLTPTCLKGT